MRWRLLAFWVPGRAQDVSAEVRTDIVFPGQRYAKAIGVDLLNGREQELLVTHAGNATVLRGMLSKDYPVLVRFR